MQTPDDATLAYLGLTPDDILTAVESLGYSCDGRFLALNSYENRVYRVGIEGGSPMVTKFYRPQRWTDEAIVEEHQFSIELAARDVPVVTPVEQHDTTLHRHSGFRFALYPYHGGRTPELDNMNLLRQIGRLVARLHLVGATKNFSARPTLDVESFGHRSHNYLLENDFIPPDVAEAYTSTCELIFEGITRCYELAGSARFIRLHADFHPSNVLVDQDVVHIVDLDDARMGPAIQDLWMFLSGNREEQTPQLEELLSGYTEFNSFNAGELHLIEALRTLRIMHYAAWIARRWQDPAFQRAFPWFDTRKYWDEHILTLREQVALMFEEPLEWR
ncbi:MAG TPA: serine/threonine protein kinase [Gammaproteobacteria bacterium]|jgi:Ser/Thr protein kinase RdoA (MazF antagonist)|nr:serine/threonine protein kinase [Chromatiales bacterium]MCP4924532.1 serine/threonine protein kinase [Gammaproteobacteria bacterium]MDP7153424.1 serine/threonine protein kinase [Gammaproteobacteria bacterium]MDP7297006.1 serine/threonine protein kinase [Gammaproteobacteria bacterium]MDP7661144.1 serine/threonine protein kinase [Gammaproteobacteria bacterium]